MIIYTNCFFTQYHCKTNDLPYLLSSILDKIGNILQFNIEVALMEYRRNEIGMIIKFLHFLVLLLLLLLLYSLLLF